MNSNLPRIIAVSVLLGLLPAAPTSAMAATREEPAAEKTETGPPGEDDQTMKEEGHVITNYLVPIGAGLAIGLAALATGIAQARIGAAGVGAIAENPKRLGAVIMLVAIPETVAILGFVIAYLILSAG